MHKAENVPAAGTAEPSLHYMSRLNFVLLTPDGKL